MLTDTKLTQAISSMVLRAEKQSDINKLLKSFVDPGLIAQLLNKNNQIFFGRRGTGKTHVLIYLEQQWKQQPRVITSYIDLRTLSSSSSAIGDGQGKHHQAVGIFKDILSEIHTALLGFITDPVNKIDNSALAKLDEFADSMAHLTKVPEKLKATSSTESSKTTHTDSKINISHQPSVGLTSGNESGHKASQADSIEYDFSESLSFINVHRSLSEVLRVARVEHFYLLLDEWATINQQIQPAVSECLKKALLPIKNLTLKIASIEYRSDFYSEITKGHYIGFELGGDISASLTLDDYYVYDSNPEVISEYFANVIYKHLESDLPDNYLQQIGISGPSALPSKLFSEKRTFEELVRAAEGVTRDCINIMSSAYFSALQKRVSKVDLKSIAEGAQKWFEQDKRSNLSPANGRALEKIINVVIGKKKARTFLVEKKHSKHPILAELFDLRVLHMILKGYSDKHNAGIRYDVFTLDYGTYIDLMKTKVAPDIIFSETEEGADRIVPFDDKRSIRTMVLDPKIFVEDIA